MTRPWRYCGPPGRSALSLVRDWVCGGEDPAWPQLAAGRLELTWRCTTAIRLVLDSWGIGTGDEVLMPAYHCGSEVDAVLSTGASVSLYRVDAGLVADRADVEARMTDRTRVLYITHYFGWPQAVDALRAVCRQKGIRVLEDCALSLFSCSRDMSIGGRGDAAVYSLSKTLGITDGGAAVWNDGASGTCAERERPRLRRALSLLKRQSARWLARAGASGFARLIAGNRAAQAMGSSDQVQLMPPNYHFAPSDRSAGMSRCARGTAARTNPGEVVRRRRHNFARLHAGLSRANIRPLVSLGDDVCPLVLPIVVPDPSRIAGELLKKGIEATAWWAGHHPSIDLSGFREATYLKSHVLALPVHQDLDDADVDHVVRAVVGLVASGMPADRDTALQAAACAL